MRDDTRARSLLSAIDDGRAPTGFDHRAHLLVAWHLVRRLPFRDAVVRITTALRRLASLAGTPDKYDEALTRSWMTRVAERSLDGADSDFDGFLERNADLLRRGAVR